MQHFHLNQRAGTHSGFSYCKAMQHFAKISTTLDFLYVLSSTQISKAQSVLSSGGSSLAQCFLLLQILLQLLLLLLLLRRLPLPRPLQLPLPTITMVLVVLVYSTSSTRTSRGRKFPPLKKNKPIRTLGPIQKNHPPALSLTCLLLWSRQRMCSIAMPLTSSRCASGTNSHL